MFLGLKLTHFKKELKIYRFEPGITKRKSIYPIERRINTNISVSMSLDQPDVGQSETFFY